jgi:arginase family enzyme
MGKGMSWKSIADLIVTEGDAPVALLGAPMEAGSVTPGRCDLAPATVRKALRRFSTYDVTRDDDLSVAIRDLGDAPVTGLMPAAGFAAIRDAVAAATAAHDLTILIGGNNAVTRPAAHGLGLPLDRIGLITLDAHFDMRETDMGPRNGNPIRCLLEDGLPGANLRQIGLAPFANTAKMAADVRTSGGRYWTIADCGAQGIEAVIEAALADLAHLPAILVDFDIDVIDRPQLPGAPGARPGGMAVTDFFLAARRLAADPKVRLVDLTEFDPGLDVSDISALAAGRWVCEIHAGYSAR